MKKFSHFSFLIFFAILIGVSSNIFAQDKPGERFAPEDKDQGIRLNFLRELGLEREQIRQIRILNGKRGPAMQEAQKTLREANRNLDQAIYADSIDEKIVQQRLQEVQTAQSEVFKIRAMSEFEIRKILTSEQLTKFRELRQKFAERVNVNQQRRQNRNQTAPQDQPKKNIEKPK